MPKSATEKNREAMLSSPYRTRSKTKFFKQHTIDLRKLKKTLENDIEKNLKSANSTWFPIENRWHKLDGLRKSHFLVSSCLRWEVMKQESQSNLYATGVQ